MSYVAGYVTKFQSTPPVREESHTLDLADLAVVISIHSSRAGGVRLRSSAILSLRHFNPRPPTEGVSIPLFVCTVGPISIRTPCKGVI